MWLRLGGPRVVRYRDGRFENVAYLDTMEDAITAMTRTRDGTMLLAGIVNGPLRWSGERLETLAVGQAQACQRFQSRTSVPRPDRAGDSESQARRASKESIW